MSKFFRKLGQGANRFFRKGGDAERFFKKAGRDIKTVGRVIEHGADKAGNWLEKAGSKVEGVPIVGNLIGSGLKVAGKGAKIVGDIGGGAVDLARGDISGLVRHGKEAYSGGKGIVKEGKDVLSEGTKMYGAYATGNPALLFA